MPLGVYAKGCNRGPSPAPRRVTASKKTPASGLLSKLLHGTAAPASTKRKKKLRSAAIGPCSVEGEKAASKRKNAVEAHTAEAADDEGESYEDDDSSKQLSPVSVLERRAFEKPPRAYAVAEKAIVVFRELLDAARRPALLQRKVATESSKSGDVPTETSTTTTTPAPPPAPAPTRTDRATSIAHLDEMFEANGHDLVPLDMPGERGDALLGRWDVGAELAVAVLEALTEEVVTELMGMVHHEDANAIDISGIFEVDIAPENRIRRAGTIAAGAGAERARDEPRGGPDPAHGGVARRLQDNNVQVCRNGKLLPMGCI
ncbi:hypothetical protein TRIUR3_08088 [Triticum urartu]|uniref:Uncharacterized protein n=1 Tax=Triticum urartu TaxID=4572 RepID=M7ZPW5_TRIUA|nr:hypothetical protein TRIUR3_08088 [Triticum urartu]